MGPAPAIEALAGLSFNGAAFAADMAMFDFGPLRAKRVAFGPRKGHQILVGSHSLHVQCDWRLRRGDNIVASSAMPPAPQALQSLVGKTVTDLRLEASGNLVLSFQGYRLEIATIDDREEQWRLLATGGDADHLVWGGEHGPSTRPL